MRPWDFHYNLRMMKFQMEILCNTIEKYGTENDEGRLPKIEKIKRFLENKGFKVALPKGLKCCGFPYISQGWEKMFDKLKTKNINIFSDIKFKYLVVPCGTGVITFKKYYGLNGVEVYELTEFIYNL